MEGRSVGARRDQCTVSSGSSSMIIYSTSVALVRPAGPLGGLRSNVCVHEDIAFYCKEIGQCVQLQGARAHYYWGASGRACGIEGMSSSMRTASC